MSGCQHGHLTSGIVARLAVVRQYVAEPVTRQQKVESTRIVMAPVKARNMVFLSVDPMRYAHDSGQRVRLALDSAKWRRA